jgi:hypothetical protein
MRFTLLTVSSLIISTGFSSAAVAGGFGFNAIAGTHSESVYLYDAQGEKFEITQQQPAVGLGLQVILGDRDDDLQGIMKFSWISNAPAIHDIIDQGDIDGFSAGDGELQGSGRFACVQDEDGNDTGNPEPWLESHQSCGVYNVATASAGLQWRLWGDSGGSMVTLTPSIGAGVMTPDSSEYLQVELAPGFQYALSDEMFFHVEFATQLRFRKSGSFGATSYTGIRYMFD